MWQKLILSRFEEVLTVTEVSSLLDELDNTKGNFLRQVDNALGGSLFELLADKSRVEGLPLLRSDDQDIVERPDCDPRWVKDMEMSKVATPAF